MKCPKCPTYPKAANCIRCYREMKQKYLGQVADYKEQRKQYREQKKGHLRLVADLRIVLATTGYNRVGEQIQIRLDSEDTG